MKKSKPKSGVIQAAGGLVWREDEGVKEIALVHRPRYDDWSFPKGQVEKNEPWAEAALREVVEETNCAVTLGDFAGCNWYLVDGIPKIVLYWHMDTVRERPFEVNEETDQIIWLQPQLALERLSYQTERELFKQAMTAVEAASG